MVTRTPARLLVVDDDALIRAQILEALSPGDFSIVAAGSALHALALLAQKPFDLILADLHMPGMDGFEFRKRLRAEPKTAAIPFCFVTSSIREEDKHTARALGARAFLRKPVNPPKLLAFVRELLAESEIADRRRQGSQILARRLGALGIPFELAPDGTSLRAEVRLSRGRLSNTFTRAPIPAVTLENVDHERMRLTSPVHLSAVPPLSMPDIANAAAFEQAIVDSYHLHARARRREKILLESWGIGTEYDDDGCRFLARVRVGKDEITFTAADERTVRLLAATGRVLGIRPRDIDVFGATSSVEIAAMLEEVLRSLPAAAAPPPPPPPTPLLAEDPPLVAGFLEPAPAEADSGPLLEPVLLLGDAIEPLDASSAEESPLLCVVCSQCGRRYFPPNDVEDERLLTTCERCLK